MRVRDWEDIVREVAESGAEPADWRAVAGDRASGVGEDLYLANPATGVFQLKTYAKNPFEVRGVGAKVGRTVDEDVRQFLPGDSEGRFAVQSPPEDEDEAERMGSRLETVLETHADAPAGPEALFDDVMEVVESPAFGPMEYDQFDRPDRLDGLSETFADAESALEAEFDDLVEEDEVNRGFS